MILTSFFFVLILKVLFILASKASHTDLMLMSVFECGFTSYFYSRFSFSIHYFLIGLIFLFLDLEFCMIMPFMLSLLSNSYLILLMLFLVIILLMGLLMEWGNKKLEWVF